MITTPSLSDDACQNCINPIHARSLELRAATHQQRPADRDNERQPKDYTDATPLTPASSTPTGPTAPTDSQHECTAASEPSDSEPPPPPRMPASSSAGNAGRVRTWCQAEGVWGTAIIVTLVAMIINLLTILVLHCTPILDHLQGRPEVRGMMHVHMGVVWSVGIICTLLLGRVLWALTRVTCRHDATHAGVARRLRGLTNRKWRVLRAWDLFGLYTLPNGRFFDVWEFTREVFESILQILAVHEYASNGVDREFLDIYVAIVGFNSLACIAFIVPTKGCKCMPKRWSTLTREGRARRDRVVLTLDVICDALYSIFPTLYLVFSISTGLYGQRGTDLCNLMNINPTKEPCKDIQAIAILPMLVETLFGGKTFSKILLKLATRLTPLWFAASRAVEVVEALAVARETNMRVPEPQTCSPRTSPQMEGKKKDGEKKNGNSDAGRLFKQLSIFSRKIQGERVQRFTIPPVAVPVWMGATFVTCVWIFVILAWARLAQLAAPCAAAGTPWSTNCITPSHPIFDLALPGPASTWCACNAFAAAAPGWDAQDGKGQTGASPLYDCASPRFMEDVRQGLLTGNAAATTAPYVQTMIFKSGCSVNNTHVHEMFDRLSNLRVLVLADSTAIVPPLVLPGAAMTKESQLMALVTDGMSIESIPSEIGRLGGTLSILFINGNPNLRRVPWQVGLCTKLATLMLDNNAISTVPSELGLLTGLAALVLDENELSSLPDELGSLTNIQIMRLSNNRLRAIPSFAQMSFMRHLNLAGNRLVAVPILDSGKPSETQAWTNLRYMNLEGNNISAWPNDWVVQKDVAVAGLPYNTTTRTTRDGATGLYEMYIAIRQRGTMTLASNDMSLLVLMSGNPVVSNNGSAAGQGDGGDGNGGGDARLLEMTRGSAAGDELSWMLVSSKNECAVGCQSTPWAAGKVLDWIGDSTCDIVCNVSACDFDGGDCRVLRRN